MSENQKKTIIVSHRLRGFDIHDASFKGLKNALSNDITHFEVDCRITKDGEVVIHHDARLGNDFPLQPYIADKTLKELKQIHYRNSNDSILTLDELFETIAPFKEVKLYLDIKENGKEEKIIEKAAKLNLLDNIVIVSWLPEVLFCVNTILPSIQLCFSFYPVCNSFASRINFINAKLKSSLSIDNKFRNTFLFNKYNNDNGVTNKYGFDFEHFVSFPFTGMLLKVLQSVNGVVCVNYKLPSQRFIEQLQKHNLQICLYSINTERDLRKYSIKFQPDIVLTDNASLVIHE